MILHTSLVLTFIYYKHKPLLYSYVHDTYYAEDSLKLSLL